MTDGEKDRERKDRRMNADHGIKSSDGNYMKAEAMIKNGEGSENIKMEQDRKRSHHRMSMKLLRL
jgi:hypothetical protein